MMSIRRILLLLLLTTAPAAAMMSGEALAGGLTKVLSGRDAEQPVAVACVLTSRSVSEDQHSQLMQELVGESKNAVSVSSQGLVVIPPTQDAYLASCASGGTAVYCPSASDVVAKEGLLVQLAPALEGILQQDTSSLLVVVVPAGTNKNAVKEAVETAANKVVPQLVSDRRPVSALADVVSTIIYVDSVQQAASQVLKHQSCSVDDATARVGRVAKSSSTSWKQLGGADLAAARLLGPAARLETEKAVAAVRRACYNEEENEVVLVEDFGDLCTAATQQAMTGWGQTAPTLINNRVAQNMRQSMLADIRRELHALLQEQLEELHTLQWAAFKKSLSKLLIAPTLEADMMACVTKAVAAFQKSANGLGRDSLVANAKSRFARLAEKHVRQRFLKARASGQFRPVPRKGVTVGLHWLLPKPFGNDYRQEPWMVQATEGLTYVPKSKVTEVDPKDDWRNKVVPSPVGNDMMYMQ